MKIAFGPVGPFVDQLALAIFEFLLASRFAFIEIVRVDLIAEIIQNKTGHDYGANDPDYKFN